MIIEESVLINAAPPVVRPWGDVNVFKLSPDVQNISSFFGYSKLVIGVLPKNAKT